MLLPSKLNPAQTKRVTTGDPVWDTLDGRRRRFASHIPAGYTGSEMVELMDDDGKVLPDWRHPSQVLAF